MCLSLFLSLSLYLSLSLSLSLSLCSVLPYPNNKKKKNDEEEEEEEEDSVLFSEWFWEITKHTPLALTPKLFVPPNRTEPNRETAAYSPCLANGNGDDTLVVDHFLLLGFVPFRLA